MMEGKGVFHFADGRKYDGEFKGRKIHGKGTYTTKDGVKYVGDFKEGNFDGHGILSDKKQGSFEGEFKDGKKNGPGKLTQPDGTGSKVHGKMMSMLSKNKVMLYYLGRI